jgi:FAD/FMN-containing dehydrogenase
MKIVDFFRVKFSVRSGGHSPNPGWSSVGSEGILLDLQRLDSVTLSGDGKVASLGPGGRWSNAMTVLNAQGVSIQGGRLGQVGVGGLLLGGLSLLLAILQHISNQL